MSFSIYNMKSFFNPSDLLSLFIGFVDKILYPLLFTFLGALLANILYGIIIRKPRKLQKKKACDILRGQKCRLNIRTRERGGYPTHFMSVGRYQGHYECPSNKWHRNTSASTHPKIVPDELMRGNLLKKICEIVEFHGKLEDEGKLGADRVLELTDKHIDEILKCWDISEKDCEYV